MANTNDISVLVRSYYQTQDLRIETGNRLAANFRKKIGMDEGDEPDSDQQEIIDSLRKSYRLITDGIANVTARPSYDFDGLISNYTELRLVDHFFRLQASENRIKGDIERALEGIPVWDEFLTDVKGVGPTMAGVIISELDPEKAPYPSSFWKYCGLDVVDVWYLVEEDGKELKPKPISTDFEEVERRDGGDLVEMKDGKMISVDEKGDAIRVYERRSEGRSRRKHHLIDVDYIDKDGNEATRKSLSYNPFIKTKMMGVLGPSFLRTGSEYRDHYDRYRNRLENHPKWEDRTDGHIHQASLRYMVKEFLKHLHLKWRSIRGLTVPPPYGVAKQNADDHGLEEKLGIEYDWDEYPDRKPEN